MSSHHKMTKLYSKNTAVIIITAIIILFACKKSTLSDPGTGNGSGAGTGNGTVMGIITDLNNSPLSNATVVGGTATALTDANGKFTLTKVQFIAGTVVVNVTKDGFFQGSKNFVSTTAAVSNAKIQLIPKPASSTIIASSGGDVTVSGGGAVQFNPGFINATNGNIYTGNVSVSASYFNPTDQNFSATVPGDLKAVSAANQQGVLQSFGVVAVEMNDASGNKLQLASGKTATITLPIPSLLQSNAPAIIPLWYFDNTKGVWKQEGTASKQGNNYTGIVNHFSFWNVGDLSEAVNLTVSFTDSVSGAPAINLYVKLIQNDSTGTYGYTDSTGTASGLVPVNEVLYMKVFNQCGALVYSKSIGPFSTNTNLGNIRIANGNCNPLTPVAGFTYSPGNTSLPVTVTFTNTSINTTSWLWKFGDSTSSTDQNPAHTYTIAGDFPVYLTATGPAGSNTVGQVIHISGPPSPVAGFTYSVGNTSLPVTVSFTNTSTNATSWLWNFGDGTSSTLQNPTHSYASAGDFTIELKATGADGSRDSTNKVIHISGFVDDSYINLTMNGTTSAWEYSNINAIHVDTLDGNFTLIRGTGNNWISFQTLNDNASPGNYNIALSATINGRSYTGNNATTTVTEFGSVGGNIIGTGSGQFSDSTTSIPFTLAYKVKRNR